MASSSLSGQQNAFSAIENQGERRQVSESSQLSDVFINHRGPDVKQTLALELYKYLQDHGFRAFLDSEEKELGISFPSTIKAAITSAAVQIAIFSKGYAESPWCLAELVEMVESKAMVIPVFYRVKPWELRHIEKGQYAGAFSNYFQKKRHLEHLENWRRTLDYVSLIAGYEVNDSNVDNSEEQILSFKKLCEVIEPVVKKQVQRAMPLYVAKYPVRLEESVEHFETQCGMKEDRKGKAKLIGIYGMGGLGKTTLSKELFNRKRSEYTRACFLFDVREACTKDILPSLQTTLLKELFGEVLPSLRSVDEGISILKNCVARSSNLSMLVVLDDIDHLKQLDALVVMDMVEKTSEGLVIVTTRDEGVLINAGIKLRYKLPGMPNVNARALFCCHAFHSFHPTSGYEDLVNGFVQVCRGVPLSLQVLGSHVHGRDRNFWRLELNKVRRIMPDDILGRLKISFDKLESEQQQIFMDIACFFIEKPMSIGIRVWNGSEWNAEHAVEILKDRCLIQKIESSSELCQEDRVTFGMHDHLRDLGREMAKQRLPRRLWRPQDLKRLELKGFQNILAEINGRCFHSFFDRFLGSKITFFSEKWDGSAATSISLLWLQLEGNFRGHTSIPSWIPLQNLQCLRISNPHLKRLWQSNVQAPYQLKELHIYRNSLEEFSELLGISSGLENVLLDAEIMPINGWSLLVSLRIIPITLSLKSFKISGKIAFNDKGESSLVIWNFKVSWEMAFTNGRESSLIMSRLEKLEIDNEDELTKILIDGNHCSSLEDIRLHQMRNLRKVNLKRVKTLTCLNVNYCTMLKSLSGISDITKLAKLDIFDCPELELELCLAGLNCLERIRLDNSIKMKRFILNSCKNLKVISGNLCLSVLTEISIHDCPELELAEFDISACPTPKLELCLAGLNCLERIRVGSFVKLKCLVLNSCKNLKVISNLFCTRVLSIRGCPELDFEKLICKGPNDIESITIDGWKNLSNLKLYACQNLKRVSGNFDMAGLWIRDCPELEELPACSESLTSLEVISIIRCGKLQSLSLPTALSLLQLEFCGELTRVTATSHLTKLVKLTIYDCQKLEELPACFARLASLEEISIIGCGKLQSLSLPTALSLLQLKFCGELTRVTATSHLTKLVRLTICDCQKLEELPACFARLTSVEISIIGCGKLHNLSLPTGLLQLKFCGELTRVMATSHLTKLVRLTICDWQKLEELPACFARLTSLEEISIIRCGKLQSLSLPTAPSLLQLEFCEELTRVTATSHLTKLVRLTICDCQNLEELPACGTSLEEISIIRCGKLQSLSLPTALSLLQLEFCEELTRVTATSHLTKLVRLTICDCQNLEELPACGTSLEEISIIRCGKLQSLSLPTGLLQLKFSGELTRVMATSYLTKLVRLTICDCQKLEELPACFARLTSLEEIYIIRCGKLQSLSLPTKLSLLQLEFCEELTRLTATSHLTKLKRLTICDCQNLEELPACGTSLEEISIIRCGKLQSLSLPTGLLQLKFYGELTRVIATSHLTKLVRLTICDCQKLEELPTCFACLTSLEEISIISCGTQQSLSLPTTLSFLQLEFREELTRVTATSHLRKERFYIYGYPKLEVFPGCGTSQLKIMRLSNCSNAAVRNFINMLESLPSHFGAAIGRAVPVVKSILKPDICFGVTETHCEQSGGRGYTLYTRGDSDRIMSVHGEGLLTDFYEK